MYEMAFENDTAAALPRTSLALGFKARWNTEEIDNALQHAISLRRDWCETKHRYCIREAKVEVDSMEWSSSRPASKSSWQLDQLDRVVDTMVCSDFSMHFHVF